MASNSLGFESRSKFYPNIFDTELQLRHERLRMEELHSWSSRMHLCSQQKVTRDCSVLTWTSTGSEPIKQYPSVIVSKLQHNFLSTDTQ